MDGKSERRSSEGKLIGSELQIGRRNRPDQPITFQMAQRVPGGEGALPPRVEPPALHKVPYNGLAKTPPMGWNSWNKFVGRIYDATVRAIADAMAINGMKEAGYVYINIDDTWEAGRDAQKYTHQQQISRHESSRRLCSQERTEAGNLSSPDQTRALVMKVVMVMKTGCTNLRGLGYRLSEVRLVWSANSHRRRDARDLSKDGRRVVEDRSANCLQPCQYGRLDVWKWGADVGGNLWRTTGDIRARGTPWPTSDFARTNLPRMRSLDIGTIRTCLRLATVV